MLKIILSILLLLASGGRVEYDHIDGAPSGFFTIYDAGGEVIADDVQPEDIPEIIEISTLTSR